MTAIKWHVRLTEIKNSKTDLLLIAFGIAANHMASLSASKGIVIAFGQP